MPDYERALNSAINYIEANLQKSLELEEVANRAGFSQFHFMRVFAGFTGYTLKGYIRERRLSEAGRLLLESKIPISEMARMFCFESSESFIRAFKRMYRCTPNSYRKTNQLNFYTPKLKLQICLNQKGERQMDYKMREMDDLKVVGIKREILTKTSHQQIGALWGEFIGRWGELEAYKNSPVVGVCFHDPRFMDKQPAPEDKWWYMAGIIIEGEIELPEGMIIHEIPASKYAVFTHKGPLSNLGETYKYISVDWIQQVDYEFYAHDELEWYDERFKPEDPENSEYDLYIPVK